MAHTSVMHDNAFVTRPQRQAPIICAAQAKFERLNRNFEREFQMKLRTVFAAIALAATPALFAAPALAEAPAPQIYTAEDSNVAVGGFDTVSYFSGAPVAGSADFTATYKGATFQFANQENLDTFNADPAKYAPQYGGHCAWGAANAAAYPGDPKVYAIVDGLSLIHI